MVILFLTPATLLYLLLFIYPSTRAFFVSLFNWSGFTKQMEYIGLGNFKELFANNHFWNVVMKNTLGIIFIGGAFIFLIAFILSGVLTTKIKGKKFFRALIFFPSIINPVAIAILWSFIYNRQWGLLNNFLGIIGLDKLQTTWTSPDNLFWAILVALIWMYCGFYCVILLAALDRIPADYIEAAAIEGASQLTVFFKIKIPLIWDVLVITIILWGITAIKEFSLLYAWGGGIDLPPHGAQNLAVFMFINAFGRRVSIFRMGYSTSMGVVMFFMVVLIVFIVSLVTKKDSVEY